MKTSAPNDVRTFFNLKARSWASKYNPKGKLRLRLEQFKVGLCELCPPPGNILDLGCGTGEIAAALAQMGYRVTGCDIAERMVDIARGNHPAPSTRWLTLKPDWEVLPFEGSTFDAVVASSVFEYIADVSGVAAEVSRVLHPGGILLLSVPNPFNAVRKLDAWLRPICLSRRLSSVLRGISHLNSYISYVRLSQNRFGGDWWESVLTVAGLVPVDKRDFARETWARQAQRSLLLLALRKAAPDQ